MIKATTFFILATLAVDALGEEAKENSSQMSMGGQSPVISTTTGNVIIYYGGFATKEQMKKTLSSSSNETLSLIDFASLSEGTNFGDKLVVKINEKTKVKFLSGFTSTGMLKIPVELFGNYELTFKVDYKSWGYGLDNHDIFLISDEYSVKLSTPNFYLNDKKPLSNNGWQKSDTTTPVENEIKFKVEGNVIRVYINDIFLQKEIFQGELPSFNSIRITGISEKEGLYYVGLKRL